MYMVDAPRLSIPGHAASEVKWISQNSYTSNRLTQRVRSGLEQAELTIIDLPMYRRITLSDLIDQGAEAGYDYDLTILNNLTARRMISESPLGRLSHLDDCLEDRSRGLLPVQLVHQETVDCSAWQPFVRSRIAGTVCRFA
jgi:hypothetical protein